MKKKIDPDWWCCGEEQITGPWAYIVSDFQWSDEFFAAAYHRGIKPIKVKIGHWPEETSPMTRPL